MESMLQVDRLIQIAPQLFSICVDRSSEHNLVVISNQLKSLFSDLQEIVCTFDRINLFFERSKTMTDVQEKLDGFKFSEENTVSSTLWELPIHFDSSLGRDLEVYFKRDKSKVHRYQKEFLSLEFRLEFYGFLPGFCYLSGLPNHMHLNRKNVPSSVIPPGSVAVGGEQLGIYPQSSPGGWQVIGHCPVPLINFTQSPNVFISPGDSVRFRSIDGKKLKAIVDQIKNNVYHPKPLPNDRC